MEGMTKAQQRQMQDSISEHLRRMADRIAKGEIIIQHWHSETPVISYSKEASMNRHYVHSGNERLILIYQDVPQAQIAARTIESDVEDVDMPPPFEVTK